MRTSQSGWNDGQTALHFVESMGCLPAAARPLSDERQARVWDNGPVGQVVEPEREASLKVPGLASWREPGAFPADEKSRSGNFQGPPLTSR